MPPGEQQRTRSQSEVNRERWQSDGLTGRSQSEVNRERSRLARWRPKKDKRKRTKKKNEKNVLVVL
jgi:hypothetical protein